MNSILKIVAVLGVGVALLSHMTPRALAEEGAAQQATDVENSSQDAASAPSDEAAKAGASQGFDTPNADPAPTPSPDDQK